MKTTRFASFCLWSLGLLGLVWLVTVRELPAQSSRGSSSAASSALASSALQNQARQLQDQLRKSTEELQKAGDAAQRAAAKKKEAGHSVKQARDAAEKELEQKLNIPTAMQEQQSAKDVYELAKVPVLKTLHESAEYKAAVKAADVAHAKIREIREQANLSPKEKLDKIVQQNAITLELGHLEHKAIQANPKAKEAADHFKATSDKLFELKKRLQKDVEEDAGLASAQNQMRSATEEHKQALAELNRQQRAVANEQVALAAVTRQLAQAQLMRRGRGRFRGYGS